MIDEKNIGGSQEPPDSEKAEQPKKNKAVQPKKNKEFGIKDFAKETKQDEEEEKDEDDYAEMIWLGTKEHL